MKRINDVKHPEGLNTHTHTHTHVLPRREATRCSFLFERWCQSLDLARDWLC